MIFQSKTASASLLRGGLSNFGVLQAYFSLNSLDQITEFFQVSAAASMSYVGNRHAGLIYWNRVNFCWAFRPFGHIHFWLFLFQTIKFKLLINFFFCSGLGVWGEICDNQEFLSWLPLVSQECRHVQMEEISVKFWLKTQKVCFRKMINLSLTNHFHRLKTSSNLRIF